MGKTEVAKALAAACGADLVRLQCHEGIDVHQALYDWDYQRQLLAIRAAEAGLARTEPPPDAAAPLPSQLFSREFLVRRPLLEALEHDDRAVLLIDEIDRADDEFEAFLLEFLSDFQVTIPELGPVTARQRPLVVVTSNRTRELHDALKRRCLYHWIDFPDPVREVEIIRARAPGVSERLADSVATAIAELRGLDLVKPPGVAEAIDWAEALTLLGAVTVDGEAGRDTLGWAVKNRDDLRRVEAALPALGGR